MSNMENQDCVTDNSVGPLPQHTTAHPRAFRARRLYTSVMDEFAKSPSKRVCRRCAIGAVGHLALFVRSDKRYERYLRKRNHTQKRQHGRNDPNLAD